MAWNTAGIDWRSVLTAVQIRARAGAWVWAAVVAIAALIPGCPLAARKAGFDYTKILTVDATTGVVPPPLAETTDFVIPDGSYFSVSHGTSQTFELDAGPEVKQLPNRLPTGQANPATIIRDGNFFVLDPDSSVAGDEVYYQLDTGSVLWVQDPTKITDAGATPPGAPSTLLIITNGATLVVFEFDTGDGVVETPGAVRINIAGLTGSPEAVAFAIAGAINGSALSGSVTATATFDRVSLTGGPLVSIAPVAGSGLVIQGGAGAAPILLGVDPATIATGTTFQLQMAGMGLPATFEFVRGGAASGGNVAVDIISAVTVEQVTAAISTAVLSASAVGHGLRATTQIVADRLVVNSPGMLFNMGTSPITKVVNVYQAPVAESDDNAAVGRAVVAAVTTQGPYALKFAAGSAFQRINFPPLPGRLPVAAADFSGVPVWTDQGSSTGVAPGRTAIPFLAQDTAATVTLPPATTGIADRIADAVNAAAIPGLTAVVAADMVTLSNGTFALGTGSPFRYAPICTLTYTAGAGGTVNGLPLVSQEVSYRNNGTAVTAAANTGFHFLNWSDGSTANPRTDAVVSADLAVTANFAINTYTITPTAGPNGSISPATPQTVNHGASQTFTITPDLTYYITTVLVDTVPVGAVASYTFSDVTSNHAIAAYFAAKTTPTVAVTTSPSPSPYGATVTLTANVSGGATGLVQFQLDGVNCGSPATLSGGVATTAATGPLAVGAHHVQAIYLGDAAHFGASGTATHPVNAASTTTTVTAAPNPSVCGQNVTLTATVAVTPPGTGVPTGAVTFYDNGANIGLGLLSGGVATLTTSNLAVATHPITATYAATTHYAESASTAVDQAVNRANATGVVVDDVNPSRWGQSVTLTATIVASAPGAGTPTGVVTFIDNGFPIGAVALSGGKAALATSALSVGPHAITISYPGDANFQNCLSGPLSHPVITADCYSAVASSANPSVWGQGVTFTATVAGAPGAGAPTGSVTFYDNGASIGVGALNGVGLATLTTANLAVATHLITVTYGGDENFNSSVSAPLNQAVNPAFSTLTLASSANPSVYGQNVTLTATATAAAPGAGAPTGTVTFYNGAASLGTGPLTGGAASITTSALTVAPHELMAYYAGDENFLAALSPIVVQAVNKSPAAVTVTTNKSPACPDFGLVFTATVTSTASGVGWPTGTVRFLDGSTLLGTATLSPSLQVRLEVPYLASGSHVITAEYAGDGNFQSATSPGLTQEIQDAAQSASISQPEPICAGQKVTLTMTVEGEGPFAYQWYDSPNGAVWRVIEGATASTLQTPSLSESRHYRAVASGTCGAVEKSTMVKVNPSPLITQSPLSTEVGSWQSAYLWVECPGAEDLTFQWYRGETGDLSQPLVGATQPALQTPALDQDASYWVRLTNGCGHADSATARVTVMNTYYLAHVVSSDYWWTKLAAANWGAADNPIRLEAYAADGTLVETKTIDHLGPKAKLDMVGDALFAPATLGQDVWVQATTKSDLKGLVAFGTRDGESETVIPFTKEGFRRSAFPYVVSGVSGWYTGLTLVNTAADPAEVILEGRDENGVTLSELMVTLPGHGKFVRLVEQLFADVPDPSVLRSVRVSSDQPLTGFELFGNLFEPGLAGLPAVSLDGTFPDDYYFGHYFNEAPATATWYTGVTFVNLEAKLATIMATACNEAGAILGVETVVLEPGAQLTRELTAVFPAPQYASLAYVQWGAFQRVTGFELVLSRTGPFLFDGLPALTEPWSKLAFPICPTDAAHATRLRLTNKAETAMSLTLKAYDPAGTLLASYPATLAGRQKLDLDLAAVFAAVAGDLAWVSAEGDNVMVGETFVLAEDGRRLTIPVGLPAN